MELIRGLHNLRARHRGCVATIGAFDGVHLGHQAVLRHVIEKSRELQLPSTVVVFEPLPREYFAPLQAPPRLMSFREKFVALKALGIDRVLRIRFTAKFRDMGAVEFIKRVFVEGLDAKYIVVGDDLRFGRDRAGDFQLLQHLGKEFGFEVAATQTIKETAERVSSTRIRQTLQDSDFNLAEQLLGQPYSISGRVIVGQQLGRTIGIPTANLQLRRIRSPLNGVYAVEVAGIEKDTLLKGVANVGTRPTVSDFPKAILEAHVLDFQGNLYNKPLTVIFRKKLREEKKFASINELKENIENDIANARTFFAARD
jgi:riboflavin kinase/FMN adenylyltransferase